MAEWDFHKKADWLWEVAAAEVEKVEYWKEVAELCETHEELQAAENNIEYYSVRARAFQKNYQDFIEAGDLSLS